MIPRLMIVPAAAVAVLALAGCVPNAPVGGGISVEITDTTCAVSSSTAESGVVRFALTNNGSDVNEFEILAEDQLRIVGEKENITPGQTVDYVAELQPGTYYTACKFQLVGAPVGLAEFTVTGDAVDVGDDVQALADEASMRYVAYLQSQVAELLPAVDAFTTAYEKGDDATARELFGPTRVFYERIEPTAEAFGDLDPKIDYREVDALAEGLEWTGFHRIEKDLWPPAKGDLNSDGTDALEGWSPSTAEERARFAALLRDDVEHLRDLVTASDFSVGISDISNGAISLLDEVATRKISGEEDWWSHTDLWDFAANVQGAKVAYGHVREIAASQGDEGAALVESIDAGFENLESLLAEYGSLDDGFVSYDEVGDAERGELSDAVNALAEPLSQLTATVLAS